VQARYEIVEQSDMSDALRMLRQAADQMPSAGEKLAVTPDVGHELFKIGTLTDKVPQFHLLAAGNPRPETVRVSPLYQITVDAELRNQPVLSGD